MMFGVNMVTEMTNAGFLAVVFKEHRREPNKLCCDDVWPW
jgi:hypothetical protein